MAQEEDILQRIVLEGDKAVISQLNNIGTAGQAAFDRVAAAGAAAGAGLGKAEAAFGGIFNSMRAGANDIGGTGEALEGATVKGIGFTRMLSLIGRAARIPGMRQLTSVVRLFGAAAEAAAPLLLAGGLVKVAQFGAKAADEFADLAGKAGLTAEEFSSLAAAGAASGLTLQETASSLDAVKESAKQAAENVANNKSKFRDLQQALDDVKLAGDRLVEGFHKIGVESRKAFIEFNVQNRKLNEQSAEASVSLTNSLRSIQEKRDEILNGPPTKAVQRQRQLRDLDEQEQKLQADALKADRDRTEQRIKLANDFAEAEHQREVQLKLLNLEVEKNAREEKKASDELKKAKIEADRAATIFEKLGISTTDANDKLKKTPALMLELADAFSKITDPEERATAEFLAIKSGIDRKLLPSLRLGAEGFQKLEEANKKLAPTFTTEQTAQADKFQIALHQVGITFKNLFALMGLAVAPALIPFLNQLRDIFVEITPGIEAFGKSLSTVVGPLLTGFATIIRDVIVPTFQVFFAALDQLANRINQAFGTNIKGMDIFVAGLLLLALVFGGVITKTVLLVGFLGLLINKLQEVDWKAFAAAAQNAWNSITGSATIAVDFVKNAWQSVVTFFQDMWNSIAALVDQAWIAISNSADISINFAMGLWDQLKTKALGVWDAIKNKIREVWNDVKSFVGQLLGFGGGGTADVAGVAGLKGGGHIRGPGGPTGDKIPIWASDNEFMVRARAVKHYGTGFMNMINDMRLDPSGFNVGGLISFRAPQPKMKFAEGGLVSGKGGTLNLTIDGHEFNGLRAGEDTMDKLTRFATNKKIRSGGRKPNWFRG
jgi:hypothetical protein